MRRTLLFLLITLSITLPVLHSCTSIGPTSVCKGLIEKTISGYGNGYIQLDEFSKTDAVSGKEAGIEYYQIQYNVKVKCVRDGGWLDGRDKTIYRLDVWTTNCHYESGMFGAQISNCRDIVTKVGDVYEFTGNMMLTKHENGWVMVSDK